MATINSILQLLWAIARVRRDLGLRAQQNSHHPPGRHVTPRDANRFHMFSPYEICANVIPTCANM